MTDLCPFFIFLPVSLEGITGCRLGIVVVCDDDVQIPNSAEASAYINMLNCTEDENTLRIEVIDSQDSSEDNEMASIHSSLQAHARVHYVPEGVPASEGGKNLFGLDEGWNEDKIVEGEEEHEPEESEVEDEALCNSTAPTHKSKLRVFVGECWGLRQETVRQKSSLG